MEVSNGSNRLTSSSSTTLKKLDVPLLPKIRSDDGVNHQDCMLSGSASDLSDLKRDSYLRKL